jgi:hypothetical protein
MALHHITLNKKKEIMIKKNEHRAQDVNLSTNSSHNEEYLIQNFSNYKI